MKRLALGITLCVATLTIGLSCTNRVGVDVKEGNSLVSKFEDENVTCYYILWSYSPAISCVRR